MADNFLLFSEVDKDDVAAKVIPLFSNTVLPIIWQSQVPLTLSAESRVFVYVNDLNIPGIIESAIINQWHLAILPHPEAKHAWRGFCLQKPLEKAVQEACQAESKKVDVLRCNGELVLDSVMLADGVIMFPGRHSQPWPEKIKKTWKNIRQIKGFIPFKMTLITANDNTVNTAAIGLVVVEHAHGTSLSRNILPDSHINDGMCHAMVLAPRSIMELIRFFAVSPFWRKPRLPTFLGLIKSRALTICCAQKPVNYIQDGVAKTAEQLIFNTEPKCLNLLSGDSLPIEGNTSSSKESRRTANMPSGEAIMAMIGKSLPFITHAATEEFKELYQLLRENAKATPVFLTLMVLSTLLASIGLYANSAPVIIGAMILAPLMAPIISFSMALTRQDTLLLSASSSTLLTGLMTALGFASIASFIMPMEIVTPEIQTRLSPNLLDLAVAVLSGIAGAYAHARVDAAKSLAGVAIAVALVPPLAVTGIGLGWFDLHVAGGALLLFLTNLAGIVLSASLTFLVLGFAPFTRAKKGIAVALSAVILVSFPLMISFMHLSYEAQIIKALEGTKIDQVILRHVSARDVEPVELTLDILTANALSELDLDHIKQAIEDKLQTSVILEAQVVIRRE